MNGLNGAMVMFMLLFVHKGTAIRCYSCDSRDENGTKWCKEPFIPTAKMVTECPFYCATIYPYLVYYEESEDEQKKEKATKRFCSLEGSETCEFLRKYLDSSELSRDQRDCEVCDTDYCNGPPCQLNVCLPPSGFSPWMVLTVVAIVLMGVMLFSALLRCLVIAVSHWLSVVTRRN